MNTEKIRDFTLARPGQAFPWHRPLSAPEQRLIYCRLCRLTGLSDSADSLSLVKTLEESGRVIEESALVDFAADIQRALATHRVLPRPEVYVNWYRFDEIDQMRFSDVIKWFPDLWYTAAEDPDIFDDSLGWMLSLRHYWAFTLRVFEPCPTVTSCRPIVARSINTATALPPASPSSGKLN